MLSITIANRTDLPAGATFNAELRRVDPALKTELLYPDDRRRTSLDSLRSPIPSDVVVVSSYLSTGTNVANASAPEPIAQFHSRPRAATSAHDSRRLWKSVSAPTSPGRVDVSRRMGRVPGFSVGGRPFGDWRHANHGPSTDQHSSPVALRRRNRSIGHSLARLAFATVARAALTLLSGCY